jgi:hypothetical protein
MRRLQPAYMLLEVFLAMSIATVAIAIASNLQLRAWIRVTRDHDDLEKVFLIKERLYAAYAEPNLHAKKVVTQLENPLIKITTEFKDVPAKSSLAVFKDGVSMVKVLGAWKFENTSRVNAMIMVVPRLESKAKTGKKTP